MLTIEQIRDKYKGEITNDTIRGRLIDWAICDAKDAQDAITMLEQTNCAGCSSPAPIYYNAIAGEIATHYDQIQEALDDYEANTGEKWQYKNHFTEILWFAYEWIASNLASELANDLQESEAA